LLYGITLPPIDAKYIGNDFVNALIIHTRYGFAAFMAVFPWRGASRPENIQNMGNAALGAKTPDGFFFCFDKCFIRMVDFFVYVDYCCVVGTHNNLLSKITCRIA
jgi:hypothetical protein